MRAAQQAIRLLARLASGDWQCGQCGNWFSGAPSQTCPGCS
jgi:rubrerythrin